MCQKDITKSFCGIDSTQKISLKTVTIKLGDNGYL